MKKKYTKPKAKKVSVNKLIELRLTSIRYPITRSINQANLFKVIKINRLSKPFPKSKD